MLTILFDGIAYGMLLFVLACGLAVTLGLMNFVNLAHGAFAMAGGYVTVVLVNRLGVPFLAALPLAFLASLVLGAVMERTLYVHVYAKSHLEQVLFTIGLGLDPIFPLKFLIYFLIVVTVGGTSSITGPFLASLLLGIADVAGKYYVPKLGAFVIYTIMIAVLIWRPQGLFGRVTAR